MLIGGGFGKNIVIYGVDSSSSAHVGIEKNILILGKDSTDGLDGLGKVTT